MVHPARGEPGQPTERGVAQATELAGRLAGGPVPAAIYASPLRRAAQTADIIAARLGLPVITLEELRELDVGDLEGRADEQAWGTFLEVAYAWQAGDYDRAFPCGEDYHQVTARLTAAFRRALAHPPGSRVLAVAHDGLIRTAALRCLPPAFPNVASPS